MFALMFDQLNIPINDIKPWLFLWNICSLYPTSGAATDLDGTAFEIFWKI